MKELKCARREQSKEFSIHHNGVRTAQFWILAPDFWLLSCENIFSENEPKLCPSLLTILKKRTQNEPKLKPNEPKNGAHLLL
jgi:hypothetical protein